MVTSDTAADTCLCVPMYTDKVVKPHVPLIKFRKGRRLQTQESSPHKSADLASNQISVQTSSTASSGYSLKGTGIDELELPAKYGRKPLSQLEMETIERGGPE